jgi:pimeloyl-ACP methyl ester carboxylesterase
LSASVAGDKIPIAGDKMPVAADLYYHSHRDEQANSLPVVLIHGAGGNYLSWPPDIRRLPGCRVFALDLPGHGKSGGRGRQSVPAYASLILEWLGVVGIYRAVLVGHSMGGAIAIEIALAHPERVVALGLVSTAPRLSIPLPLMSDAESPPTFHKVIEWMIEWVFSAQADPHVVELATQRLAEIRPAVLQGDFLACNDFDATERLADIHQPTLVLCGLNDRMTPLRQSQMLAGSIPNARLEVIAEAGHMVMLERPKEVAKALSSFLASVPYPTGS